MQGILDIEGCGFESLPKEVWSLADRTALKALNLTNNRLKDLPEVGILHSAATGLISATSN